MDEVYAAIWGIAGGLVTMVGAALAVSSSIDRRFAALKESLSTVSNDLALRLEKLQGMVELLSEREASHWDQAEYRIHANTELIDHRTKRLLDEDARLERKCISEINEIKGFLEKTTNFQGRDRRQ